MHRVGDREDERRADHACPDLRPRGGRLRPTRGRPRAPRRGPLGVWLATASVLARAWEHVERVGRRGRWAPEKVLVTGAGPIGLLAALMGVQRGLEVHVLDRVAGGPKPALVRALGAAYHTGP